MRLDIAPRVQGSTHPAAPDVAPPHAASAPLPSHAMPPPLPSPDRKRPLPAEDEPEPAEWDDECFICGQAGKLTCCDVCPRVYHLRCLPAADSAKLRLPSSAEQDWWCPRCRKVAKATFCMSRELSHPELGEEGADPVALAHRLFAFMSDPQHEGQLDPLREAAASLLQAMPRSAPWLSRILNGGGRGAGGIGASRAAQQAADQLAARVSPDWWVGACLEAEPPASTDGGSVAEGGGGGGGGGGATKPPGTSIYRGVSKRYGKWKARIKEKGSDVVLGDFDDEIEAAKAYDRKARLLHGEKALVNFPEER